MERCIGCHSCCLPVPACSQAPLLGHGWNPHQVLWRSLDRLRSADCLACDPAPVLRSVDRRVFQRKNGGVVVRKSSASAAGIAQRPALWMRSTSMHREPFVCIHCGSACLTVPMIVSNHRDFRGSRYRRKEGKTPRRLRHDQGPFQSTQGRSLVRAETITDIDGRDTVAGGSGLAAMLFGNTASSGAVG